MKASRPRRAPRTQANSPAGLRAILAALIPEGFNAQFPASVAGTVNVTAQLLTNARGPQDSYEHHVFAIARRMYQGTDKPADTQPDLTANAGFWLGVATCWHLMNAINGRDGAR